VGGKNLPPVESLMLDSAANEETIEEETEGTESNPADDITF
jgi:hypothetical protein